jgi:hypothetical protein
MKRTKLDIWYSQNRKIGNPNNSTDLGSKKIKGLEQKHDHSYTSIKHGGVELPL